MIIIPIITDKSGEGGRMSECLAENPSVNSGLKICKGEQDKEKCFCQAASNAVTKYTVLRPKRRVSVVSYPFAILLQGHCILFLLEVSSNSFLSHRIQCENCGESLHLHLHSLLNPSCCFFWYCRISIF